MEPKFLIVASFAESLINFRGPLIQALLTHGQRVHVAAPDLPAGCPIRSKLEEKGAIVHDLRMNRAGTNAIADLKLLIQLYRLMHELRPEKVLCYTVKPIVYGTLAAWLARVPGRFALVTGLGYAFTGKRLSFTTRLVHRLYKIALRKASKVFFQNPDDQALLRQSGILHHSTASVIVNGSGVDLAFYSAKDLPALPLRFLMIARLLGDKGVREYAAAAGRVRASHPDVVFELAGWIDENPSSIAQGELDSWIEAGYIRFVGRTDDVRPYLERCHVYVLPSYAEGTPRTVLEAMALGRAIITTDAPGCRETTINGDNGWLVPVRDVDQLVGAMLRFIEQPEMAKRMGERSLRIVEDKYDVLKVNEFILAEVGVNMAHPLGP